MRNTSTRNLSLVHIHMPTTMVPLDRNTAENNVSAIVQQNVRVPGVEYFESCFPRNIHMAVTDRHPSNLKAESFFESLTPKTSHRSLHFACDVHKQATALKNTLAIVEPVVSGVLNCGLCMDQTGCVATLRDICQRIFMENLEIVFDNPPEGEVAKHRKEVLNLLCVGDAGSSHKRGTERATGHQIETKRRFILNYFCNSDLQKDAIIHYCPYSCCPSPQHTMQMFCKHVAYALIPRKCPTLSRKSWTGSDAAFDWLSLLAGFWNLHERILVKYTGFVKSVSDQPDQDNVDRLVDVLEDQGQDQDDFFDDDHMEDWARLVERLAPEESAARGECLPDSEQSWAEFNKGCRKRTGAFVTSKHVFEKLVLTTHVLQIALRMLYVLLQMASAEWLKGQENVGPERMFRILETAKGTFIRKSMEEVQELMVSCPTALPINSYVRRARSLLFRLLSFYSCNVEFLMGRTHKGFPFQLFRIFCGEASHSLHVLSFLDFTFTLSLLCTLCLFLFLLSSSNEPPSPKKPS